MSDGKGGTFVFRFPSVSSGADVCRWSRKDSNFQFVGASGLGFGGGEAGYGLWLSADLSHGTRCAPDF